MAIILKTAMGVKHGGIRRLQDLLVNLLSKWPRRAKITHMGGIGGFKPTSKGLFVSPLATLAFKLCVVGDTGLKTGWERCRHGAGRGGVVTYFADLIVLCY